MRRKEECQILSSPSVQPALNTPRCQPRVPGLGTPTWWEIVPAWRLQPSVTTSTSNFNTVCSILNLCTVFPVAECSRTQSLQMYMFSADRKEAENPGVICLLKLLQDFIQLTCAITFNSTGVLLGTQFYLKSADSFTLKWSLSDPRSWLNTAVGLFVFCEVFWKCTVRVLGGLL